MRTSILLGATAALALAASPLAATASPLASVSPAAATTVSATATTGAYTAVKPVRILDTRSKNGVSTTTPVGAGATLSLQVSGRGGVPASGVSAVVLNLTAVNPTAAGYLAAYPAGQAFPGTSSVNFAKGGTRANLVTVPLGTGGKISIRNATGATHVLADVTGYYLNGSTTVTVGSYGSYQQFDPFRAVDTRTAAWGKSPLEGGMYLTVPLDLGPTESMHVKAVAVNVTATGPTAPGYLTAWAGDSDTLPGTSTVNYLPKQTTPNMAIVPVSTCTDCADYPVKAFDVDNVGKGSAHVIVDVVGYFDDDTSSEGLRFKSIATPKRIVDTRSAKGMTKLAAGQTRTVVTPSTIAGPLTGVIVANVAGVLPSADTFLTLWANYSGLARPAVSHLNPAKGTIAANMAIVEVGNANDFKVFNGSGTTDVIVDVTGTMEYYQASPAAGRSAAVERFQSSAPAPRAPNGGIAQTR